MLRTTLVVTALATSLASPAAPASGSPAPAAPTCRGLTATVVGTSGDDRLTGTPGPDVIVGRGGDDVLRGVGGDDVVCGGAGADDLRGGEGDDLLYGGKDALVEGPRRTTVTGDVLEGGPGDDLLSAGRREVQGKVRVRRQNTVTFRHSDSGVSVDLRARTVDGEGADVVRRAFQLRVEGSRYDDELRGGAADDVLDGLAGDDTMDGRGGDDVLLGYRGSDVLGGDAGDDLVISTAGRSTARGGDGHDWVVLASHRPSTALGGAGHDYVFWNVWEGVPSVVDGGPGRNQVEIVPLFSTDDVAATVDAAAGTATFTSEDGTQVAPFSNMGAFVLTGWLPWTYLGRDDADFVQVLDGTLDARGEGGDDVFFGAEGDDLFDGGDGTDAAWGAGGHNTCVNTETGDCNGSVGVQGGRETGRHAVPSLAEVPPHRLVARWTDGRDVGLSSS